jgi:hypothetical protein
MPLDPPEFPAFRAIAPVTPAPLAAFRAPRRDLHTFERSPGGVDRKLDGLTGPELGVHALEEPAHGRVR